MIRKIHIGKFSSKNLVVLEIGFTIVGLIAVKMPYSIKYSVEYSGIVQFSHMFNHNF